MVKKFVKILLYFIAVLAYTSSYKINIGSTKGIYIYEIMLSLSIILYILTRLSNINGIKSGLHHTNYLVEKLLISFGLWVIAGYAVNFGSNSEGIAFIGASGMNISFIEMKLALNGIINLIVIISAYILGKNIFNSRGDYARIMWIVLISATFSSLSTSLTWFAQTGGAIGRYNFELTNELGYGGVGAIASIGIILSITTLRMTRSKKVKIILYAILMTNIAPVIFIGSRAIILIVIFEILVLFYLHSIGAKGNKYSLILKLSLFTVTIFYATSMFGESYTSSLASISNRYSYEIQNKLLLIESGLTMFSESPLFGKGYGFFQLNSMTPIYVSNSEYYLASPHNGVIHYLSETGIIGMIICVMITWTLFIQTWKLFKGNTDLVQKQFLGITLVMLIVSFLTQFIQGSAFFPPAAQRESLRLTFYIWFFSGISMSIKNKSDQAFEKLK
jgi:O-antigen ligase